MYRYVYMQGYVCMYVCMYVCFFIYLPSSISLKESNLRNLIEESIFAFPLLQTSKRRCLYTCRILKDSYTFFAQRKVQQARYAILGHCF